MTILNFAGNARIKNALFRPHLQSSVHGCAGAASEMIERTSRKLPASQTVKPGAIRDSQLHAGLEPQSNILSSRPSHLS